MSTPYTTKTGVQIGRLYTRPMPVNDIHMDRIQSALLKPSIAIIKTRRSEFISALRESAYMLVILAAMYGVGTLFQ